MVAGVELALGTQVNYHHSPARRPGRSGSTDSKRLQGEVGGQKLDELLPRLQGTVGDFVFSQLQSSARGNYRKLVQELNSRFQLIELPKAFRIKLSNRIQRSGETAEEYAADLKNLYDNAFPNRSTEVRQEDLLRYFLDGLQDDHERQTSEICKRGCLHR